MNKLSAEILGEITRRIKVGCETLDPSVALGLAEATPGTSAFAAAIGLAIAQGDSALPFDFLAPKQPQVKRDMRKVRVAAVFALGTSPQSRARAELGILARKGTNTITEAARHVLEHRNRGDAELEDDWRKTDSEDNA